MARKGNQHKSSLDHKTANRKQTVSGSVDVSLSEQKEKSNVHSQNTGDRELSSGGNSSNSSKTSRERLNGTIYTGVGNRNKQRHHNVPSTEKSDAGTRDSTPMEEPLSDVQNTTGDDLLLDAAEQRGNDGMLFDSNQNMSSINMLEDLSMEAMAHHIRSSVVVAGQRLRLLALDAFNAAKRWLEQQKPRLSTLKAYMCHGHDYILIQIKHVYPIIWTWILHIGQLMFLLSVICLDCNIRGLCSLLRLGTTSFFTVAWCSILSVIAMVGFTKVLIITAVSAVVGVFIGLALGILILAIFAAVSLWLYGSFWITSLVIFVGGSSFGLSHERTALLVTTTYAMYCAKNYVGWLGLFLCLNLSFLSTDILTYFLKRNMDEQGSHYSEQDRQTPSGGGHFNGERSHFSPDDDVSASRSAGVPSTSGCELELTSEGEVLRLLYCSDHYSALGFARFENVDVSLLKREYRKKAMLVHPDKNMGNEKAVEAFKKLQNAYEVLLDTLKRKTYDDELRREELLNYFRRFQSASQKNGKHNIFSPGFCHFEGDDEGSLEESRRIACKKCGDFHKWTCMQRSKSRARWCQDCNDFHQAKDGDGWLEQSLHPFLFGLLHKVDAPCAYVCADGRIYDATEWFICQGMRCPANTHKPSFHVNTALSSKQNTSAKGASTSHRGGGATPIPKMDETMTEEELFEWLQDAMQSGVFETSGASTSESHSAKSGSSSKGNNGVKKKRKGKKQW